MEVSAELSASQGGDVSNGGFFGLSTGEFGDDSLEQTTPVVGGSGSSNHHRRSPADVDAMSSATPPPPMGGGGAGGVTSLQPGSNTINPRQQQELCLVCGDRASGYHYNALTCEGCKGFFRRSITKNAVYQCKYGNSCDIDMYMRRKCQECRLKKCLVVGMRPECVVPEYQCAMKRESKKQMPQQQQVAVTTITPGPVQQLQHVGPTTPTTVAVATTAASALSAAATAAGAPTSTPTTTIVLQPQIAKRNGALALTTTGGNAAAAAAATVAAAAGATVLVAVDPSNSSSSGSSNNNNIIIGGGGGGAIGVGLNGASGHQPIHVVQPILDEVADEKPNIMALNMAVRQVKPLTQDQEQLINKLVYYQQEFESPSDEDIRKITPFPLGDSDEDNERRFQHITEITILTVQLIVEFSKRVPGFDTLLREDQITLLKACSSEIMMLRGARKYDVKTDSIVFANNQPYTRDNYKSASVGDSADALFRFCRNMCNLRVDNAEYALLTAIVIFSERPSLLEPEKVERIQEFYIDTLRTYSENHRPPGRTYFARLLSILTELRTLGNMNAEMCFQLKVQNKKLPPFLAEIWDIQE